MAVHKDIVTHSVSVDRQMVPTRRVYRMPYKSDTVKLFLLADPSAGLIERLNAVTNERLNLV